MPQELHTVGDREFWFTFRREHGQSRVALDVKYRGQMKISNAYLFKLKRLAPDARNVFTRRAEELTQKWWWDWAKEEANTKDIGKIYSDGRSGGWLVIDAWSETRVQDECQRALDERCVHCQRDYVEHVLGKCIFMPTRFSDKDGNTEIHDSALVKLITVETFLADMDRSLESVSPQIEDEFEHLVDEAVGELDAALKLPRIKTWAKEFFGPTHRQRR